MKLKAVLMMAILMAAGVANASIIMTVDTSAETFSFSGSDSLVIDDFPTWSNVGGLVSLPEQINCVGAFSYAGSGFGTGNPWIQIGSSGIRVTPQWYSEGASSVTATGTSFSYSSLSSGSKTYLEGLDGTFLSDQNGGAGVDQLEINVIPEPSVIGLMALMGGGLVAVRRIFTI